jgi:hypothetical protein
MVFDSVAFRQVNRPFLGLCSSFHKKIPALHIHLVESLVKTEKDINVKDIVP